MTTNSFQALPLCPKGMPSPLAALPINLREGLAQMSSPQGQGGSDMKKMTAPMWTTQLESGQKAVSLKRGLGSKNTKESF